VSSKLFSSHAISKDRDNSRLSKSHECNFETVLRGVAYTVQVKVGIWIRKICITARLNSCVSFVSITKINKLSVIKYKNGKFGFMCK